MLTWGMQAEERKPLLTEGLADWEAMAKRRTGYQILWRAIRGIPSAIWIRLSDRETTSLPAGLALSLVGLGGIAVGLQSSAYPFEFRRFVMLTALGLMLVGVNFVRDPRRIVLARYRLAATISGVGFAGLAVTLPRNEQWPYEDPVLQTAIVDRSMQIAFVIIATGFLLLLASSFIRSGLRLATGSGLVLMIGVAALGVTQLSWAFAMTPVDLTAALASIVIGLAALSFVHVMPRLRHMRILGQTVHPEDSGFSKEDVR
jgi:hypothetical protein